MLGEYAFFGAKARIEIEKLADSTLIVDAIRFEFLGFEPSRLTIESKALPLAQKGRSL